MSRTGLLAGLLLLSTLHWGQHKPLPDSLSFFSKAPHFAPARFYPLIGAGAAAIGTSYLILDQAWYADYPRGDFHFFDDDANWLQMDKLGHAFTAYQMGYASMELFEWSGVPPKPSYLVGGSLGLAYLTGVELMDGYSEEWGFSVGDMLANGAGALLLIGQEWAWQEQRITMKFSYHPTGYARRAPELLGRSQPERLLKDYNGQSYWLSANLRSLGGGEWLPPWLNLAVGYGADGMLTATRPSGAEASAYQRQFYLAPDIDLRKLPFRSPFWKMMMKTLNFIKVPLPTLEIDQSGGLRFHPLYF